MQWQFDTTSNQWDLDTGNRSDTLPLTKLSHKRSVYSSTAAERILPKSLPGIEIVGRLIPKPYARTCQMSGV
eukprot:7530552-Ditylum_brightwellii.AAC.1